MPPSFIDAYRITPETLWVVFFSPSKLSQAKGMPPVMHAFQLAEEGQGGLDQIRSHERDSLLLALSLDQVRGMGARMGVDYQQKTHGFVGFTQSSEGVVDMVISNQPSESKALKELAAKYPQQIVALCGAVEDFRQAWGAMEKIVSTQDFWSIRTDRRRGFDGKPDGVQLLMAKRTVRAARELAIE